MRRRRACLLILGCLAVVVIFESTLWSEREPKYMGKKWNEWAEIYDRDLEGPAQSADTPRCREAVEAVRHLRDQVLPRALELLQYEKPEWKNKVENTMERLNIRRWGPRWVWRPFYGQEEGWIYFHMLGPAASPAVPELVRIINETKSFQVAEQAIDALSYIGKEGLPPLLEILANPHDGARRYVALTIGRMHSPPTLAGPAVPLLIKRLNDPDIQVATAAAMALGELGLEAGVTVPALSNCLLSTNAYLREYAAESLRKFGLSAHPAVPALLNVLSDSQFAVRAAATNALQTIEPGVLAKTYAP